MTASARTVHVGNHAILSNTDICSPRMIPTETGERLDNTCEASMTNLLPFPLNCHLYYEMIGTVIKHIMMCRRIAARAGKAGRANGSRFTRYLLSWPLRFSPKVEERNSEHMWNTETPFPRKYILVPVNTQLSQGIDKSRQTAPSFESDPAYLSHFSPDGHSHLMRTCKWVKTCREQLPSMARKVPCNTGPSQNPSFISTLFSLLTKPRHALLDPTRNTPLRRSLS